jgi:ABC-type nitrate/sulfonate/bicarbonate transport system substrate-binding protein
MLADIEKEVQFAYTGVAVSNRLLAEQRVLVERFLRGVVKGREYARRYREQTIAFLGKHNGRTADVNRIDYDSTLPTMTAEGAVSEDALKEDVAIRAELLKVTNPPGVNGLFDYSLVKKIYEQLKADGWRPKP